MDGLHKTGGLHFNATYGGSTGLGALDIAALQAMYGANTSHNSGGNTYTLPSANVAGTGYQAIWDTGGIDTIQHVGSSNAQIDLRAATLDYSVTGGGAVSFAAGVKGGFTIAHGVVIENASGGSGADIIIGNTAQNVLRGNDGNDTIHSLSNGSNNNTIYGGQGNDIIFVAQGTGADQVFGDQGNDLAVVRSNAGTFTGGTGTDTVRFVSAISNYLFFENGVLYEFLDVITRTTFTIADDVELVQFLDGLQQYSRSNIKSAMQLSDIDTQGTTLQHASQGLYVLDGGSSNIALIYGGQSIGQNSLAGWQALQAEASGGGYKVLWQNANGSYAEWTTDTSGQYVSGTGIANVVDVEAFYGVDLNNDGQTGHVTTNIETSGSTAFASSTRGEYLINGTIGLSYNGNAIGPDSLPGWQALQAEASGGGYKVLWQNANGSYAEWTTDASGQYVSGTGIANVVDVEAFYGVDLNNDGQTGHVTTNIETSGSTAFASSTRGEYLINGTIGLSYNGNAIGPDSLPGWQALQAEASGGGYKVLWQNANGSYAEWTTDASGQYQSGAIVANVVDVEVFYGHDIDGNGTIGPVQPKLSVLLASEITTVTVAEEPVASEWDEDVDYLEFRPDLATYQDDEDIYGLVVSCEKNNVDAPFTTNSDGAWHEPAIDVLDEDANLTIASLLEEDSFWW